MAGTDMGCDSRYYKIVHRPIIDGKNSNTAISSQLTLWQHKLTQALTNQSIKYQGFLFFSVEFYTDFLRRKALKGKNCSSWHLIK